ncbi:hypothetical protein BJI48_01870 [Helicobacter sp. 11S02596-1]|nr:hypothetical protein BJI48_01870 [Helicobacter sp. 11S02596-1]
MWNEAISFLRESKGFGEGGIVILIFIMLNVYITFFNFIFYRIINKKLLISNKANMSFMIMFYPIFSLSSYFRNENILIIYITLFFLIITLDTYLNFKNKKIFYMICNLFISLFLAFCYAINSIFLTHNYLIFSTLSLPFI